MGRSDDDAHMVVSDDEESSPRQVRSVSTGFPYETLVRELREVVTMLHQVPETVTEELSEHKVSARYKEKHGEILRRELTRAREAVERLIKECGFTQVLSNRIVEELDKRGVETIDDWDQYLRTMEKDGEMLAQIAGILNVDVLQIVKAVKEVKATADAGTQPKAVRPDANGKHADWSVLRAEMEALCGDIMGDAKRGNSEQTLIEILGDDHLGGRAKSVFLSLPVEVSEESSPRQVRSVSTGFPYETLVRELREVVTMLHQVPETVTEELSEHKVSARYKEKHGEILRRELTRAREAVERLIKECGFTQVLSNRIVEELDKRGVETIDDWDQYLRTMEKDGEMLAQIAGILNVDVLQIVKAVKEVKATADAGTQPKAVRPDANGKHADWSVLRAEMEALCGDIMGDAKRGNRSASWN
ncbi:unnamed protein product [Heligmosomoides polygyrus]|uniref:DUF4455 domain-containing protein n=1 Tax=Heligmosomoides polygyrus TaxID=6339 RepID=A0A183FB90_HELPZ|nr:unnamed protein product [Heligmosomoides polygyrus]